MKVAIIGAGFTGLAAAYYLAKGGVDVQVFERESQPGGLAIGFKDQGWDWPLEQHYHHIFTSDNFLQNLGNEVGHKFLWSRPVTSTYLNGQISQLDSPLSLLQFPGLPLTDRLRTAVGLGLMRFNPVWQPFEYFTAKDYIRAIMGERSWQVLWRPLFEGKFASHSGKVSAAWFWARIYKRSATLGYPEGGFQSLAESIEKSAKKLGAKFNYNTAIASTNDLFSQFDKVICTLPTPVFEKLSGLSYPKLTGIGAVNLVLSLKRQFLPDGSYWLNVNDKQMPFLAVVEHTNFIDPSHYRGDRLLYVGNYLSSDHEFFNLSEKQLLKKFSPHLQKINSEFNAKWVKKSWVFKAPFAQPIVTTRYSKLLPKMNTSIRNLYLANIQQVYPWDRGTNYAVELGQKASQLCLRNSTS